MRISFEKAVGGPEKTLLYTAKRAEVLSNNIANADTPNFKARDVNFASVLAAQNKQAINTEFSLAKTNQSHLNTGGLKVTLSDAALLYRVPNQASIDQNTVDVQVEQAKYAENSIRFQAAFTRLNGAFKGLMMALKGE